jgi:hypothetical protein
MSRYGAEGAKTFEKGGDDAIQDSKEIPIVCRKLREVFDSDHTLSREWRLSQLKAIIRMLTEDRKALCGPSLQVSFYRLGCDHMLPLGCL